MMRPVPVRHTQGRGEPPGQRLKTRGEIPILSSLQRDCATHCGCRTIGGHPRRRELKAQ